MPSNTPELGLYKKNPATDGNDTFNVETMLNENWDKIDAAVVGIQAEIEAIPVVDISPLAPKANPTFTETVTLPGDPTSSLHAATKAYVDAQVAIAKTYAP